MEAFEFSNVEAKKAEAMRRYNRQKNFSKFLFVLEVLAALALFSWFFYTHIRLAVESAKDFLRQPITVFGQSLVVLMIINVLIILIFVLSSQTSTKADFYDEYVAITTKKSPALEETVSEKQIVCVDNAVNSSVLEQNIVPTVTEADCEPKQKHGISSAEPKKASPVSESKKYRRTRSERLERENRRELRRSETVMKGEMVAVTGETARRSSAMDDLSNEEFRLTIETFIASQKKSLIRENTLDLKPERNQCVAITVGGFN